MHSVVHTSKEVMKMCSHLLREDAFAFYSSSIGIGLNFSKMESQRKSDCVLTKRGKDT